MRIVVIGEVIGKDPIRVRVGAWCRGTWVDFLNIHDPYLEAKIRDVVIIDGYLLEDSLRDLIKFKILDLK